MPVRPFHSIPSSMIEQRLDMAKANDGRAISITPLSRRTITFGELLRSQSLEPTRRQQRHFLLVERMLGMYDENEPASRPQCTT